MMSPVRTIHGRAARLVRAASGAGAHTPCPSGERWTAAPPLDGPVARLVLSYLRTRFREATRYLLRLA